MKKKVIMGMLLIMLLFSNNIKVLGADGVADRMVEETTDAEDVKGVSGGTDDYTQEEYDEFYKTESVQVHEIPKTIYTVTFIDKVNRTRKVVEVTEGEKVQQLRVKKKYVKVKGDTYKVFKYWRDSKGKAFDFEKGITKNISLYAYFVTDTPNEKNLAVYTVFFNTQGGTREKTIEVNYGKISEPEKPYKSGYVFKGWYTKATGGQRWDFKKDYVTDNVTLYAHWIRTATNTNSNLISPKTGYDFTTSGVLLIISFLGAVLGIINVTNGRKKEEFCLKTRK